MEPHHRVVQPVCARGIRGADANRDDPTGWLRSRASCEVRNVGATFFTRSPLSVQRTSNGTQLRNGPYFEIRISPAFRGASIELSASRKYASYAPLKTISGKYQNSNGMSDSYLCDSQTETELDTLLFLSGLRGRFQYSVMLWEQRVGGHRHRGVCSRFLYS